MDYLVLLSDKLATKYPEMNARIQRAVSIVRAGGVQLHGDDLAAVTNGGEAPYEVTGEGCACEDFVRGNAPHGRCKHRLAAYLLRQTQDHFDPNKSAESPGPRPGDPQPVPSVESGTVQGQKPTSPYTCPEPKYWVKGGRRTLNKAEKEIIDESPPGGRGQVQGVLRRTACPRCGATSSCFQPQPEAAGQRRRVRVLA